MRTFLVFALCSVFLFAGCKSAPKRKPAPLPPMPSGLPAMRIVQSPPPPPAPKVTIPTNVLYANISAASNAVVIGWQRGTSSAPYLVWMRSPIVGTNWVAVGNPTIATQVTAIRKTDQACYRVQASYPTVTISTNSPRLRWNTIDVMPQDFYKHTLVKRFDGTQEPPDWNAVPLYWDVTNITTVVDGTQYGGPYPGHFVPSPGTGVTTNVYVASTTGFSVGDHVNEEGYGHYEIVSITTPHLLVLKYSPKSDYPNNTHGDVPEYVPPGARITLASFNLDQTQPTPPNRRFYDLTGKSDGGTDIPQNVVSLTPSSPGMALWARNFGGPNTDQANAVCGDASGNIFITGYYDNSADFGDGTMGDFGGGRGASNTGAIVLAKYDSLGRNLNAWPAKSFGIGVGNSVNCTGQGWAVASRGGKVVMVGGFHGTIDFSEGTDPTHGLKTSLGALDIFVAAYDAATGAFLWAKSYGTSDTDGQGLAIPSEGKGVAIDSAGNVFVTGNFGGAVNFGDATRTGAGKDIFVIKLAAATGATLWSRQFGSTAAVQESGFAITVDSADAVLLTGLFSNTCLFPQDPLATPIVAAGPPTGSAPDIFIVKYSSMGVWQWAVAYGDAQPDNGACIAVDSLNNVVVAGVTQGPAPNLGGATVGTGAAFLAKYSGVNGSHIWSRRFGGSTFDTINGLGVDSAGDISIFGSFIGTMDCGSGETAEIGSAVIVASGVIDAFIAKYHSSGAPVWAKHFGKSGNPTKGISGAVGPDRAPVLVGQFRIQQSFDSFTLTPYGGWDVYLLKASP